MDIQLICMLNTLWKDDNHELVQKDGGVISIQAIAPGRFAVQKWGAGKDGVFNGEMAFSDVIDWAIDVEERDIARLVINKNVHRLMWKNVARLERPNHSNLRRIVE